MPDTFDMTFHPERNTVDIGTADTFTGEITVTDERITVILTDVEARRLSQALLDRARRSPDHA